MVSEAQPQGTVAVIFAARRTTFDEREYAASADAMEQLAARQPGYRGIRHARREDGYGITVSYWADEASARAWHDNPDHAEIRDRGRERWYDAYTLEVALISRSYAWSKNEA